ncbi:hypothetical protein ERJ75_001820100 [Trypanosoma vivax]|nr:hypothetical protein TRVL_01728 [Trypanosoma vivax]KAH8603518.1 hypothetical protein ERJ75_001820100 [Trypanosoma vivax]
MALHRGELERYTQAPFQVATFSVLEDAHDRDDVDEDVPENLRLEMSCVPGVSAAELLSSHRKSLADMAHTNANGTMDVTDTSGSPDLHSITLSRRQLQGTDMNFGDELEENFEQLKEFQFGEDAPSTEVCGA